MTHGSSSTEPRILALWLTRFQADRREREMLLRATPRPAQPPSRPFILYARAHNALRVTAVNAAAANAGLTSGLTLADARAMRPDLYAEESDPEADRQALLKLCDWCARYSPWVAPGDAPGATSKSDEDGAASAEDMFAEGGASIFIDITGCAHLFGGEDALLSDLARRLEGFGFAHRIAIASTPGAAWALAHYGQADRIQKTETRAALAPLPVDALRLSPEAREQLRRLGLKRIAQLYDLPRAPLTARFGAEPLNRLAQALGERSEPLSPRQPSPQFRAEQRFAEPLQTLDAVRAYLERLSETLEDALNRHLMGARWFQLTLYRVDGHVDALTVGTAAPMRSRQHVMRLFANKLDGLHAELDAGFGYDMARLAAHDCEKLTPAQLRTLDTHTADNDPHPHAAGWTEMLDRLSNRLGPAHVVHLRPVDSHMPERAIAFEPIIQDAHTDRKNTFHPFSEDNAGQTPSLRPIRLLPAPEPIEAIAAVPDAPPSRFQWRKVAYHVVKSDGPERLAPEWWRMKADAAPQRTRDYYRVEDEAGRRFWIFRSGLYGRETASPTWFMHGFFA